MGLLSKIGTNVNVAASTLDNVTQISKSILCLPSLLRDMLSPSLYIKGITSVVTDVISVLEKAITGIIQQQIDKVSGVINNAFQVVDSLKSVVSEVTNTINSVYNVAVNTINNIKSQPNCANANANIFNCIVKTVNNKITNKVAATMYNKIDQLTSDISANTSNILDNIAQKELKLANKIRLQTKL